MISMSVKHWKESFEKGSIEEIAMQNQAPIELIRKIKEDVEKSNMPDDVLLVIDPFLLED